MITFENLRTLGKPIAYYPKLAKPLGGVNAVILFSHLLYWHDKTENDLGVYKTVAEIENETGLTEREQKTACEKLENLGILSKKYQRLAHRMYYKLHPDVFNDLMFDFFGKNSAVGEVAKAQLANNQKRSSRTDKSAVGEVAKAQLDEPTKTQLDIRTINYQENTNNNNTCDTPNGDRVEVADVEILEAENNTVLPKNKKSKKTKSEAEEIAVEQRRQVKEAYIQAYKQRYGVEPITENAKFNSLNKKLVDTVGFEEAVELVRFYPNYNSYWHIQKAHDFSCLISDLQAVRNALITGKTITQNKAKEVERQQETLSQAESILAKRRASREKQGN